jgi:hypothetical protein
MKNKQEWIELDNGELFPIKPKKPSNNFVQGVGINDANYVVKPTVDGKRYVCPYYTCWKHMLERCYDPKYHATRPTYIGCTVDERFIHFMEFRKWMKTQIWFKDGEKLHLDKDLRYPDNKIYSPNTCLFIPKALNGFFTDSGATRGACPIGVNWHKSNKQFRAQCRNPFTGKRKPLGYFDCKYEAHRNWANYKIGLATKYMDIYCEKDTRILKKLQIFCIELLSSKDYLHNSAGWVDFLAVTELASLVVANITSSI